MYFLEDVVLPPGEKIRRIRSYLGIRQHDITGNKITRNLISYIENDKIRLTRETAEIIVENVEKLAGEKKIPLNISVEYLMLDDISQAELLLDKCLENMKYFYDSKQDKFQYELSKANNLLKDWDIPEKKADIYEMAGDYYYEINQFNESYMYYLKSLENNIRLSNHKNIVMMYIKLAKCAIALKNFHEAINLNNYARFILREKEIQDPLLLKKILFNIALAHKKLETYDECLDSLKELVNMDTDFETLEYIDILMLRANCYVIKGNYETAEQIYIKILDLTEDHSEIQVVVYLNLGKLYLRLNEKDKANVYINKGLEISLNNNDKYLIDIYLELGKIYKRMYQYDLSKEYLLKALEETRIKREQIMLMDIYRELLDLYIRNDDDRAIDELVNELNQWLADNLSVEVKEIILMASYYYIEKDTAKSKKILMMCLQNVKRKED